MDGARTTSITARRRGSDAGTPLLKSDVDRKCQREGSRRLGNAYNARPGVRVERDGRKGYHHQNVSSANGEPMRGEFQEAQLPKKELENVLLPMLEKYEVVLVDDPHKPRFQVAQINFSSRPLKPNERSLISNSVRSYYRPIQSQTGVRRQPITN